MATRPAVTFTADAVDGRLGGNAASIRATARALAKVGSARTVILVEGISDQIALQTAAAGLGRDFEAERVVIVPIGGAHAVGRLLATMGPSRTSVRLAGLCDVREEKVFRRGLGTIQHLGCFVCVNDLEEELIRAVGTAGVEALMDENGDLRSFRCFQKQPAWRGQDIDAQLHRFVRSGSRRCLRYARLLTEEAVARGAVPRPLGALLTAV